jgi:hypothetical protein
MYCLPKLKLLKNLTHAFFEKTEGNMSFKWGGDRDEVLKNRQNFLKKLNLSSKDCVTIWPTDKLEILTVGARDKGLGMTGEDVPEADALITADRGVFLFLLFGDCLPVIFFDPVKHVVALAHLGWKSTENKLAEKVLSELGKKYGSRLSDLTVALGPGIHKDSYCKGTGDWLGRDHNDLESWKNFSERLPDGRLAINLVGYNLKQLVEAGVSAENIEVSEMDTAASDRFFSHYRSRKTGEKEGRSAAVVGII